MRCLYGRDEGIKAIKTTLLIMAAGIGSRFGGGIKQLAPVDDAGHIIVDYSIHDAIATGFNKIVFIIRRDFEADFREVIGKRIEVVCASLGVEVDVESLISMNMWGLTPGFMQTLEEGFQSFFETAVPGNPLKAEYLLPIYIGQLLRQGKVSVKVLPTADKWFGVTYQEDKPLVVESFRQLIAAGVYREDLYSDLSPV